MIVYVTLTPGRLPYPVCLLDLMKDQVEGRVRELAPPGPCTVAADETGIVPVASVLQGWCKDP